MKEKGESFLKLKRGELFHLQEEQVVRFGMQRVKVSLETERRPWLEKDCNPKKY